MKLFEKYKEGGLNGFRVLQINKLCLFGVSWTNWGNNFTHQYGMSITASNDGLMIGFTVGNKSLWIDFFSPVPELGDTDIPF
jgi:hypothetical protein